MSVLDALQLVASANAIFVNGCALCKDCPDGGPYDPNCPIAEWMEAAEPVLAAAAGLEGEDA